MILITVIIAVILTYFFLKKKREIEKKSKKKDILYHFYGYSLEFLIPFLFVALLYSIIPIYIWITSETVSLQALIDLEESLTQLKSRLSIFKLSAIQVFIILLVIYILGILRLPAEKSKKFIRIFAKYRKTTRLVFIVLVLLCSFTLFGTHLGKPTNDLKVRINTIREGYADIFKEVQEDVAEEITYELFQKVKNNLPSYYTEALSLPKKIDDQISSLDDYYKSVRSRYGINSSVVESTINKRISRIQIFSSSQDIRIEFPERISNERIQSTRLDPTKISSKKIKEAKKFIAQYRDRSSGKSINLLKIEGGKEVIIQIPKILTNEIKTTLVQSLIELHPILEPMIDVFKNTIDKEIESRVEKTVDHVINSIVQTPKSYEQLVKEQSSEIVNQKNIEINNATLQKIYQASGQLQKEFKNVNEIRASLFKSIAPSEPQVKLNSNLSVDISWTSVPDAKSYRVYWTNYREGSLNRSKSEATTSTSLEHWPSDFPTYYRVAAVKDELESRPSRPREVMPLSSQGGRRCQICGGTSIGWCHIRRIYVCYEHNIFTQRSGGRMRCP